MKSTTALSCRKIFALLMSRRAVAKISLLTCGALVPSLLVVCFCVERGAAQQSSSKLPGARPTIDASEFPSIQAALDAVPEEGALVRLPAGKFEIREPLVIHSNDVCLEGSGTATHISNLNEEGKPAIVLVAPDSAK